MKTIYKVSDNRHRELYKELISSHDSVEFIKENDFKSDLLTQVRGYKYIFFMVDDNLFIKDFSVSRVTKLLAEESDTIGFSLRLGSNIKFHYPSASEQEMPLFTQLDEDILKYDWTQATRYFSYPLELSSSIYRVNDLIDLLINLAYRNPNTLEAELARQRTIFAQYQKNLFCYRSSVAFCNPVNIVQNVFPENRKGNNQEYSANNLASLFENGCFINVFKYLKYTPVSCHQEVEYEFLGANSAIKRLSRIKIVNDSIMFENIGYDNSDSAHNGEYALLPYLIKPGDVIFDVGANQGEWSTQVLTVQPNVLLYAFEPLSDASSVLKNRLSLSGSNVFTLAISDTKGEKTFYYYNQSPQLARMSSLYHRMGIDNNLNIRPIEILVKTETLDTFCENNSIARINLLKIDTEGAELSVLKGSAKLLTENRITILQFEYGGTYVDAGATLKNIFQVLTEYGYILFRILPDRIALISQWRDSLENYRYSNYLAVAKLPNKIKYN